MIPLAGKHAVVVGATGTIGAHIARAFAAQGAVVSLLGRTALQARAKLEPQLTPYTASHGQNSPSDTPTSHRFIRLDVADRASIKHVFGSRASQVSVAVVARFRHGRGVKAYQKAKQHAEAVGPLDVLVNCAGISQTTLLKRTPDEELASILDTNLLSTMLVCKHASVRPNGEDANQPRVQCSSTRVVRVLMKMAGCIINVSSLMATKSGLGVTAYSASKAGVVAFTRALCREMAARSIRVNALLPGWVQSSMWDRKNFLPRSVQMPFPASILILMSPNANLRRKKQAE
ncbi:carbonic reductase 4 [Metarhizium guizhouense ARSEF 977]|uniref:Hydroxynaphthalene reductase-like protein Arp2 n=1 Tax=Metarhizium guizhouense (strain ARSEF 977) TaxID=1276136 RepID=A0A0B4I769_METGA|nr:carbonic reductase 4 [Metarhizium guizhouense ARSEF 977]